MFFYFKIAILVFCIFLNFYSSYKICIHLKITDSLINFLTKDNIIVNIFLWKVTFDKIKVEKNFHYFVVKYIKFIVLFIIFLL